MVAVAVIGAGIAGLSAAYQLQRRGLTVTVFEASDRVGGAVRTEHAEGFLLEFGPNTLQRTSSAFDTLINDLNLSWAVLEADPAAVKRYVVRDGKPTAAPTSPASFLTSSLLSLPAKLGLLRELFVDPAPPDKEESVADFVRRRLGQEVLDYAANPFIGGIFAGDPEHLSLRHVFPQLHELEQQYGSVIKGQFKEAQARKAKEGRAVQRRRRPFSFEDGLQMLPDAMGRHLEDCIRLDTPVTGLRQEGRQWFVGTGADGEPALQSFDAVIYAAPLHRLADISFEAALNLKPLIDVAYPPVTVLCLGFRRRDIKHPLDGFGVLVPEAEADFRILGTLFSSSLFPNRAPGGHVLLTTFIGGTRHPHLTTAALEVLTDVVLRDLHRLLGVHDQPVFSRHYTWPKAIPQYHLGYGHEKRQMEWLERQHPGLFFAGNYRQGVSVVDTVDSAQSAVRRITKQLI